MALMKRQTDIDNKAVVLVMAAVALAALARTRSYPSRCRPSSAAAPIRSAAPTFASTCGSVAGTWLSLAPHYPSWTWLGEERERWSELLSDPITNLVYVCNRVTL